MANNSTKLFRTNSKIKPSKITLTRLEMISKLYICSNKKFKWGWIFTNKYKEIFKTFSTKFRNGAFQEKMKWIRLLISSTLQDQGHNLVLWVNILCQTTYNTPKLHLVMVSITCLSMANSLCKTPRTSGINLVPPMLAMANSLCKTPRASGINLVPPMLSSANSILRAIHQASTSTKANSTKRVINQAFPPTRAIHRAKISIRASWITKLVIDEV
jgi:hypothetical protein